MTMQAPPQQPKRFPQITAVSLGVAVFLVWQFTLSIWRLAHSAGSMDNKFSALARDKYLTFLLGENAKAAIAYLILGIIGTLLILPIVHVWSQHGRHRGFLANAMRAALLAFIIHGFFTLRLYVSRPYFINPDEFGHWYYKALDLLPHIALSAIFHLIPLCLLAAIVGWYLKRMGRKPALAFALLAIGIGTSIFTIKHRPAAPPSSSDHRPPNILIIGSDSLRADVLGCQGHRPAFANTPEAKSGVSPRIDALAKNSIRFEQCYTAIASTMESGTQLMASQYPHTHGLRHMFPCRENVDSTMRNVDPIAKKFRAHGYDTAAIGDWCAGYYEVLPLGFEHLSVSSFDTFKIYMSQAVILAHSIIPLYFDNSAGYLVFPQIQSFAQFVKPEIVTRRVTDRLRARARDSQPFFWHVFYSCNHLPYRSGEPYNSMFANPRYAGKNRSGVNFDINSFIGKTDLQAKWQALPPAEVEQIRALYDGCTRSFDDCVGHILDTLHTTGLDQNTIVIITSDHGDDLCEPGAILGHGLTLTGGSQAFHTPMIVHLPGAKPAIISENIRLIDLAPTLAELADVSPSPTWEGKSFAKWLTGQEPPCARPVYCETGFPFILFQVPGVERPKLPTMDEMTFIDSAFNYQFVLKPEYEQALVAAKQRALQTRHWKLVATPTAEGTRHYTLYHLAADSFGEHDLAATRPEVLAPMRTALDLWIDSHTETPIEQIFPNGEPQLKQ